MEARITRLLTVLNNDLFDRLPGVAQGFIESDRFDNDICMEVDDFLQFSLIHDVEVSEELLSQCEAEIHLGWDPELTDRTLGW
ncbi:MAG: hypothetical protein SPG61_05805, partial [Arcanobacterium sp.]|nr:hypothetical protein [Arcanobacterium sp.]